MAHPKDCDCSARITQILIDAGLDDETRRTARDLFFEHLMPAIERAQAEHFNEHDEPMSVESQWMGALLIEAFFRRLVDKLEQATRPEQVQRIRAARDVVHLMQTAHGDIAETILEGARQARAAGADTSVIQMKDGKINQSAVFNRRDVDDDEPTPVAVNVPAGEA